jgi:acylphosphatase
MKSLDIVVQGRVQGVFFSASTLEMAQRLGVHGTVQNLKDGSVRIEAEADEAAMSRFLAWVRRGPPGARVDRLDLQEGEPRRFRGFTILPTARGAERA